MPLNPPVPVAGTFTVAALTLVMDFSLALQPGPLDFTNWTVHAGGTKYNGQAATAGIPAAHQVTATFLPGMPPPAPGGRAYYNPPPFDVRSLAGTPAALFAGFPIAVI